MSSEEIRAELGAAFGAIAPHDNRTKIARAVDELVALGQNRGPALSEEYKAWLAHSARQAGRKTGEAELERIAGAALKFADALEAVHEPAYTALNKAVAAGEWRAFIARRGHPAHVGLTTAEKAPLRRLDLGYVGAVALRALAEQARTAKGLLRDVPPQRGHPRMNQRTHHVTGAVTFHFEQITGVEDIAPPGRVAALERLVSQVFRILGVKASGRAAIRAWLEWREKAKIEAAAPKAAHR
jgi:hypothetical protein